MPGKRVNSTVSDVVCSSILSRREIRFYDSVEYSLYWLCNGLSRTYLFNQDLLTSTNVKWLSWAYQSDLVTLFVCLFVFCRSLPLPVSVATRILWLLMIHLEVFRVIEYVRSFVRSRIECNVIFICNRHKSFVLVSLWKFFLVVETKFDHGLLRSTCNGTLARFVNFTARRPNNKHRGETNGPFRSLSAMWVRECLVTHRYTCQKNENSSVDAFSLRCSTDH